MLSALLRSFQLSQSESLVFEQCVRDGIRPASFIAKRLELPRNTVRGILDALVQKGLIVRSRRANQHLYAPESCDGIRRLILSRREEIELEISEQLSLLEESEAELTSATRSSARPRIRFYEGYEGLRRVYEDTLTTKEAIRSWGSFDANRSILPKYFRSYYSRRAKKGIPMRSIHPETPLAREHHRRDKKELRKSVLIDKSHFDISPEIQVYNDKVNIVSGKDRLGIIIESREIADAMRQIFELSFVGATALNKKSPQQKRKTKKDSGSREV